MRILSGIQPTGPSYHVGNYLGAIKQWIDMQDNNECIIFIADLHALTVPTQSKGLSSRTLEKVAELIALGIDPERCTLFVQSHIPEHTELAWILNTISPIGDLERMTQFKDKSKKMRKGVNAGLLNYPVLQAADILMYKPDAVPVGKDQVQHLELTRTLAKKFNTTYGKIFPEPEAMLPKGAEKILSLQDPKRKMSKSDADNTQISMFDEPAKIKKKIKSAVTDNEKTIKYSLTKKPGISNLLTLYAAFSDITPKQAESHFKHKSYADLKNELADLLITELEPFREKKKALMNREVYLMELLARGARKAKPQAEATMKEVRSSVGLLIPERSKR